MKSLEKPLWQHDLQYIVLTLPLELKVTDECNR